MAFLIPSAFVLLCLVNKLTVIGIIGNTQGVSNASKPEKRQKKNSLQIFGISVFFWFYWFRFAATISFVGAELTAILSTLETPVESGRVTTVGDLSEVFF